MFTSIYKKLVIDFPKVTLLFLAILIIPLFGSMQASIAFIPTFFK